MKCLPRKCRQVLEKRNIHFKEHYEKGVAAVEIKQWKLPDGKFDADLVDLLLLIPDGYPHSNPDMFFVHPWIKVNGSNEWPEAACSTLNLVDRRWQRWSRHWFDWRPGVDGMPTILVKVKHALETA